MTSLLARLRNRPAADVPTEDDITAYLTFLASPAHPAGGHPYQPTTSTGEERP